ncbi:MAG: GGDEF domain-containing protein [Lachnospiraceae bacterium]|nr:GGDEF domain-containing protein [Lachnospiraceae bacterium]
MEKQNRSAVMAWIVPALILIIVIFVMMFNFSSKSSADASETISRNLIRSAQTYGENFSNELEILSRVAGPFCVWLEQNPKLDESHAAEMAEILYSCTSAHRVIYCDSDGQGVDQAGESVSVGNEEYFRNILQSDTLSYVYVDEEGTNGAIAVVQRIDRENGQYYVLMYFSMDKFSELMTKSDFDASSFLILIDSEGRILGSAGATESNLLQSANLLETLQKDNSKEARTIRNRMDNGSRGTTAVTVSGESCTLAYVPFGANRWEVVLGVSQAYVDRQVNLQWQNTKNMLFYLVAAVFVFICMIVVVNIIGKLRNNEKKKELEDKADTDLLTGLTNKLATERRIKDYMAQNPNTQSMLFILDVDNFKKINDTMGHAFGDEVLRSLGQQITAIFRATDVVGRVGGDEFMIFLKGVSDEDAIRKEAKKVENFFRNFQAGEYVKYAATASIGVAIFPQEGSDFESLYKAADQGLYKAKKRGKNQLAFYRDEWMPPAGDSN